MSHFTRLKTRFTDAAAPRARLAGLGFDLVSEETARDGRIRLVRRRMV